MSRVLLPILALAVAGCGSKAAASQARPANAPAPAPTAAQAPAAKDSVAAAPNPFKKFNDVVKGATKREGYFETYEKGENL